MKPYIITIEGDKNEWRYNLKIMGEATCNGERVDFFSYGSDVADLGSAIYEAPSNFEPRGVIRFESHPADALTLYIYGIPHTLPETMRVDEAVSPELHVIVSQDGAVLYNCRHLLNPWTGANIRVELGVEE